MEVKRIVLIILLLLFISILRINANDKLEKDTLLLKETIVIGQRFETELLSNPAAVSKINETEIILRSPMNLPDLLQQSAGVWMQKTNHGGGSPFIRGLTGYQTLILIDGIRFNNSTFRSGPNQYLNTIDPFMLQNVEILRGAGSVQYGSDAIGGTIYLSSKFLDFSDSLFRPYAKLYGKWMTDDLQKSLRAEAGFSSKKSSLYAGFTFKDLGDIITGGDRDKLYNTGYREYAGNLNGKFILSDKSNISFAWQHHHQIDVPLYHKLSSGKYAVYSFNPQQRDLGYLKYHLKQENPLFFEIRSSVSYQRSLEKREKQKSGDYIFSVETDVVESFGFTIENISRINNNWEFITGIEVYNDKVNSKSEFTNLETNENQSSRGLYPDNSGYLSTSVFTLHTIRLKKLKIFSGLRYNYFVVKVSDEEFGDSEIKPNALVGNLNFSYQIISNSFISFGVNNAFRAPNINDVSSFGIADYRYEIPNYDLQPEKSFNKEIGFKTHQKFFSTGVHFYHNRLSDLIKNEKSSYNGQDSIEGIKVYQRKNVDKAYITGIEFEWAVYPMKRINLSGYLVYTYGYNESDKEPMRRIPPFNGLFKIGYFSSKNLALTAEWQFAAKQDRLSSGDIDDSRIAEGGTPGWQVINLKANYQIKNFLIIAGLNNILNEDYRIHGSGIDGIGRAFWASLSFRLD